MKIVLLDAATFGDVGFTGFNKFGEVEIFQTTSGSETCQKIADADIVIINKVELDARLLKEAKKLKLICVAATGVNNIDLKSAKDLGIGVCNVPSYSTSSVVCHTFSMFFYLMNHLRYYDEYCKSKKWCDSKIFSHLDRPFWELEGKMWGIIGLGTIGKSVAKAAEAFGCDVSYYSTSGKNLNQPYRHYNLKELLKTSNVVSIHTPLNEKTFNLIDLEKMRIMKKDAILLNLGRGGIVNEKDLAIALDSDLIGGAGIDVLEKEPPEKNHPLLNIKNTPKLFMTPHIAWAGIQARKRLVEEIIGNIKAFLDGKERNRIENKQGF